MQKFTLLAMSLILALTVKAQYGTDVTHLLTNPDFEVGSTGWLIDGGIKIAATAPTYGYNETCFMEDWVQAPSRLGDRNWSQTIEVPNGVYAVKALAHAVLQSDLSVVPEGVSIYANGDVVAITTTHTNPPEEYSVSTQVTDGKLTVGLRIASCNVNWVAWDNVRIIQYSAQTMEEAEVMRLKDEMNALAASAQEFINGKIQRALAESLTAAIERIESVKNLNEAQALWSSMNTMVAEAQACSEAYIALQAKIEEAYEWLEKNLPEGYNSFEGAIATAESNYEEASLNVEETKAATKNLNNAIFDFFMLNADGKLSFPIEDIYVTNPTLRTSNSGWTYNPEGTKAVVDQHIAEFFNVDYDMSQTIEGLPNGKYKVSVTGFYRATGNDSNIGFDAHENDTEEITAMLYANDYAVPFACLYEHNIEEINAAAPSDVTISGYNNFANSMHEASICFDKGFYSGNEVAVVVTDGKLKFGIRNQNHEQSSWTAFRDFRLTYYGMNEVDFMGSGFLTSVSEGNHYVYYTDAEGNYHFLNAAGQDNWVVSEAPVTIAFSQGNTTDAFATAASFMASNGYYMSNAENIDGTGVIKTEAIDGTNGQSKRTWESQVFYKNAVGKYAIRLTNTTGTTWGANCFVNVDPSTLAVVSGQSSLGDALYLWEIADEDDPRFSTEVLNKYKEELDTLLTAAIGITPTYSVEAKAQLDAAIVEGNVALSATTSDKMATAISKLKAAIARAERSILINAIELTSTSIVDFTQFVVNPDMSNGTINGWTTTPGWQYQASTHTGTGSTISQFQEQWTWGTGLGDLSSMQTLMDLPNGTYIITVDAVATTQYMDGDYKENTTGAYWVANDQSIAIATYSQPEKFYILTEVTDGILQMGMVGINTTANWMAFDNVKVTYYGEDIDAELVKEGWRFTDGHLVVYRDFPYTSSEEYPWHSLRQQITSIEFVGGVTRVGNWAFYDCDNLTTLTIPEGITAIGYEAFYSCGNLNTLSLPESLITIERYAFEWCTSLTSITLPSRLETIDYCAFIGCQGLTSITIPTSVTSIGHNAFGQCTNLTSIVVEEGNTVYDSRNGCNALIETATNKLIQGCNATVIPEGIVTIGEKAFQVCTFSTITIPEGVSTIEYSAFDNCYNLTEITLPSSLTTIGNGAFSSCGSLTEITIPASVTTIDGYAFSYCGSLTEITIPANTTSIKEGTFAYCGSLTSIMIEEGNTVYDSRNGCNAIIETATNKLIQGCNTTVIPEGIVTIGEDAFYGCTFSTITIPEGVTTIEDEAFWGCYNLTSITIPASVTTIDGYAFSYCQSLARITSLATTAPTLGDGAFSNISPEAELYYPEGSDYSSWMKYFPTPYYMKNVATGTYLQAGANGIQAALGTQGLDVRCMVYVGNRYTIRTGLGHGYLNHEGHINGAGNEWIMEQHANGYYTFENSNNYGYYLGYDGEMVSVYMTNTSDANAQWQLVTKEERLAELAEAAEDSPMNATFLIRGAAFNNGDPRNQSWVGDYLYGGYDNGYESNYCAEQWDVDTIDIHQELAGIPNGYYRLAAQGFYRMNDGSNNTSDVAAEHHAAGSETLNALLYANEKGTPLMSIMEGVQEEPFTYGSSWQTTYGYVPHDMTSAAWAFTAGLYQNSLWVYVNDGTLRVGVKKNEGGGYDWTIFDNFNLYYYGTELTADASDELSFKLVYAEQLIKNNPTVIGAVLPALQAEIDVANNIENLDKAIDAFEAVIPVYKELQALVEEYKDNKRVAIEVNAGKAILTEKNAATQSVQDTLDALKLAISTLYEMEVGEIFTYTNSQGVEKRYRVLGTNMIANASFHNGTDGWTGGAGGALTNAGWHAEGGMDGGAYICPTNSSSKISNNSIGTAWEVVKGNTYVFSYYISNAQGEAVAKIVHSVTSETDTPRGEESKVIMYAHTDADYAWTQNRVVTTAEYDYLQFCARLLGGKLNFDAFFLAEVEEIPDPKELLDLVDECEEWLAHYDDPEGEEPLEAKIDEAEALVEADAYNVKIMNAMIASLSDALLEFRIANASVENPVIVNAKYGKNLDFESAFTSWTTENESIHGGINIRQLPYFGETIHVCEINGKPIAATSISQVIKGLPTGYYKVSVDVVMNHGFNGQAGAMMSFNDTELDITTDEITLNDATAEESHPQTFVIESFVTADSVKLTLSAQAEATFTYLAIDNIEIEYYGKYIELGDVNNDFRHTMNDVVMTVNAVLEKPSMKFNPYAADMNMNDDINMGDVVNILHMVLNDGMDADYARSRMTYDNALALTAHETLVSTDATSTIPVALSNENNYAAFQIDVELPEGVTFVDATLSNRATSTHTLSWNTLSNGKVRIIAYSADNAAFKGNEGDLINLVVKASDMMVENSAMTITKGIFVTTSGAEQTVEDIEVTLRTHATDMEAIYEGAVKVSGTTGAIIVETNEAGIVDIYTVTGQLVHSATTVAGKNIITVPAGIYVVNNSKVIVK